MNTHGVLHRLTLALAILPASLCCYSQCGVERHDVKDLLDSPTLDTAVNVVTIPELIALKPPKKISNTLPRQEQEKHIYLLTVLILGYKFEADQDFHVVVADPTDKTVTMIVEIPSPTCVKDPFKKVFTDERNFLINVQKRKPVGKMTWFKSPLPAMVQGVLFFDKIHGQTGVAPNGVELHPLLAISQ